MARSNQQLVPGAQQALDQWKYEIAAELGLAVGKQAFQNADTEFATELGAISAGSVNEDYWGHISARDTGAVGGAITRKLVQMAQQSQISM